MLLPSRLKLNPNMPDDACPSWMIFSDLRRSASAEPRTTSIGQRRPTRPFRLVGMAPPTGPQRMVAYPACGGLLPYLYRTVSVSSVEQWTHSKVRNSCSGWSTSSMRAKPICRPHFGHVRRGPCMCYRRQPGRPQTIRSPAVGRNGRSRSKHDRSCYRTEGKADDPKPNAVRHAVLLSSCFRNQAGIGRNCSLPVRAASYENLRPTKERAR